MPAKAIRCSSLDDLFACAPSVLAEGATFIRVSAHLDATDLGKLCHDAAERMVVDGEYDLEALSQGYTLGEDAIDDAGMLMSYAQRAWAELGKFFVKPQTEAAADGPVLSVGGVDYQVTGTLDLCSPAGQDKAIFLDWKSGYLDDGYLQQMTGYAYLLWQIMGRPASVSITGIVVFLRHRYYRVLKYDAAMLARWEHDLVHNILPSRNDFHPSRRCRFCDLFSTCPARQAVVAGSVEDLMGAAAAKPGDEGWLERAKQVLSQLDEKNKDQPIVADCLADMLFRIRLCQQAIENAKAMIMDAVMRVGPVPISETTALVLREQEIQKLMPPRALQTLRLRLSDTQIATAMRLSLTMVLSLYGAQFPRGQKKAMRDKLLEELTEAGAIAIERRTMLQEIEKADLAAMTQAKENPDGNTGE